MRKREARPTALRFRRATDADARALSELAFRAKARWGYPDAWMEAWREELRVDSSYIGRHRVWLAEENRKTVAYYGLELREGVAHLEHLWVDPERMGQGLGRVLFEKACREAKRAGYHALELVSDPHAEAFYLHLGGRKVGEVHGEVLGASRVLPRMRFDL